MELRHYLSVLRNWGWFLGLSVLLAAGCSLLASLAATPLYCATTTLMVGRATQNPDPDTAEILTGQQLAYTYAQLARLEPVLQGALESLGLAWDWQALAERASITVIQQTQLVEISVIDSDPQRARDLAGAIAQQLIRQSPAGYGAVEREQATFDQAQLAYLADQIAAAQADLGPVRQELEAANSARQVQDLQNRINLLETQISAWQNTYLQLLALTQDGEANALSVIADASTPTRPTSPDVGLNVLLASLGGTILAVGGIFLIEYLDDTLKAPAEISARFNAPMLAAIGEMPVSLAKGVVPLCEPDRPAVEAFRVLRTNLEFCATGLSFQAILVTSPGQKAGKTTVAANLAMAAGQIRPAGRVLLVDANLRYPGLQRCLMLPNERGLSDVLLGQLDLVDALQNWGEGGLQVLTAGRPSPDPAALLSPQNLAAALASMKQAAEVVILDGPPLSVAEATMWAAQADGVLLVVRYGWTGQEQARQAGEQLRWAKARLLGIVLNRAPAASAGLRAFFRC